MADDDIHGDRIRPTAREEEFLNLFARSQRGLHVYILAYVYDPNTAADLLQETNIVLWQKFDQYVSGTNFFAWAREVARLTVIRHRRLSSRRIGTLDPHLIEELALRASESPSPADRDTDILKDCLGKLRQRDRDLIVARYRPGASVCKLATHLGRSENSVSQSLCRIRRALVECVGRAMRTEEGLLPS